MSSEILNAQFGSEYDEFPELTDRDFQKLARDRVRQLTKIFMPASHPGVEEFLLELWIDGLATGLRMARD